MRFPAQCEEVPGLPGGVREGFLEEASLSEKFGEKEQLVTWESKVRTREGHGRQKGIEICVQYA